MPLTIGTKVIRREKKKKDPGQKPLARPAIKKKAAILTNNIIKYWLPLYIYAGIIFYFSSIPKPLPEVSILFFDKILHICEYALFGVFSARAFKNSSRKTLIENFKIFAIVLTVLYGISDEFHQRFVSQRQFSIFDIFADGIGGILGVFVYNVVIARREVSKQSQSSFGCSYSSHPQD
jgi:VanZ family protein